MRILQLGDTHLGFQRRTWGGPPGWSPAQDHRAAWQRALEPALRGEVELVIHTGDLFDRSRPPPEDRRWARQQLAALGRRCPVVVLAGNHDRRGLRVHLGEDLPGVRIVDEATVLAHGGLRLGFVPHQRQAAAWAATAARVGREGVDLLITHQAFDGCAVPGFRFRPGRPAETVAAHQVPAGVRWVLSGHLHPHQSLRCGAATVVYAGSTVRTSAGEGPGPKGTVIWELGAEVSWRFRPHPSRPWLSVREEADLDGVPEAALVSLAPERIRSWGAQVRARGGRVVLPSQRRAPRAQLRLF
jgi:DNA repair exonuclease SbcCD nuclease subunit